MQLLCLLNFTVWTLFWRRAGLLLDFTSFDYWTPAGNDLRDERQLRITRDAETSSADYAFDGFPNLNSVPEKAPPAIAPGDLKSFNDLSLGIWDALLRGSVSWISGRYCAICLKAIYSQLTYLTITRTASSGVGKVALDLALLIWILESSFGFGFETKEAFHFHFEFGKIIAELLAGYYTYIRISWLSAVAGTGLVWLFLPITDTYEKSIFNLRKTRLPLFLMRDDVHTPRRGQSSGYRRTRRKAQQALEGLFGPPPRRAGGAYLLRNITDYI
jgi:hypothetical protein